MEHLLPSLRVVLPLLIMMLTGMLVRKLKMVDAPFLRKLDNLTFNVFMPALVFQSLYTANLSETLNPKLLIFTAASLLALFVLALVVTPLLIPDRKKCAAVAQIIVRCNYLVFGTAVVGAMYADGAGMGSLFITSSVYIPLTNALGVAVLEYFRSGRVSVGKLLLRIVKHPLVIASVLGLGLRALNLTLPVSVSSAIGTLGAATTPVCLVTLGATLQFDAISGNRRELLIGTTARLLVIPVVFVTLAVLLGFRDTELMALLVMFAAPAAVSSFTMAQQMEADTELAAELIVVSTTLSVFTIFLFTFALRATGLIA